MRAGGLIPAFWCAMALAGVVDRVAVVVGTNVITESEVDEEVRVTQFLNQESLDLSAPERRKAAEREVDQLLIRNEMQVGNFAQPSDGDVDGMLRRFRQEHFSSDAQYRAGLARYSITESQLKDHLRWQLAALRFTEVRFQPGAPQLDQGADRERSPDAITLAKNRRARNSANRTVAAKPAPAGNTVDEQMDAWLKEARTQTRIEFKKGAFQ
jgi:hypothetical protein